MFNLILINNFNKRVNGTLPHFKHDSKDSKLCSLLQ